MLASMQKWLPNAKNSHCCRSRPFGGLDGRLKRICAAGSSGSCLRCKNPVHAVIFIAVVVDEHYHPKAYPEFIQRYSTKPIG